MSGGFRRRRLRLTGRDDVVANRRGVFVVPAETVVSDICLLSLTMREVAVVAVSVSWSWGEGGLAVEAGNKMDSDPSGGGRWSVVLGLAFVRPSIVESGSDCCVRCGASEISCVSPSVDILEDCKTRWLGCDLDTSSSSPSSSSLQQSM